MARKIKLYSPQEREKPAANFRNAKNFSPRKIRGKIFLGAQKIFLRSFFIFRR